MFALGIKSEVAARIAVAFAKEVFEVEKVEKTEELKGFPVLMSVDSPDVYFKYKDKVNTFFQTGSWAVRKRSGSYVRPVTFSLDEISYVLQSVSGCYISLNGLKDYAERDMAALQSFRDDLEETEKLRLKIEKKKKKYKEQIDAWRKKRGEIEAKNKALKAEYKKALKEAPESVKAFIQEPKYLDIPEKPKKPDILENPPSIRKPAASETKYFVRLSGALIRGKIFLCKEENWALVLRDDSVKRGVYSLTADRRMQEDLIQTVSREKFLEIVRAFEKSSPTTVGLEEQHLFGDAMSVIAQECPDDVLESLLFEEEDGVRENDLPPLAPIKPMHAASMLAGGIGGFFKEIKIEGERCLFKTAIVKEYKKKRMIIGEKEVTETTEYYENKLGLYNLDRRSLKILT